jgi:photosystem II stability/assembly factor-like uncharacterized protein
MTGLNGMNDVETRLRTTLSEHATKAPPGAALAERILAEVEAPARVLRPRHGWRTWMTPLLAAGAVAAVVAAVVGVESDRHTASPPPPGVSQAIASPTLDRSPAPSPSPTSPSPTSPSPTTTVANQDGADVTGFHARDLTFVSEDEGWAIGSAHCVSGGGTCTALYRTTNGRTWQSMPGAAFNVPGVQHCAAPCVDHIRFANKKVGYAYSGDVLFMTTDGGFHWHVQPGRGAEALETLNDNVIRLVSDSSAGCPGPCNVRVETSSIGSSSWATVNLTARPLSTTSVTLSRSGADAYVLATQNPSGGAGAGGAQSTLFASTDNGSTWQHLGEPCPQAGYDEVDSRAVAAAPNGTVSVLCAPRNAGSSLFVAISHDAGASFVRAAGTLPRRGGAEFTGDPSTVLVAGWNSAYRSTDGGTTWSRIPTLAGTVVGFLGFESPTVGRAVTDGGRRIWTTHDGGATWSAFAFS